MIFTKAQYEKALENLRDGMAQIEPDPDGNKNHCRICHDSGHMAWECGHNPLLAVALCSAIAKKANALHEELHALPDEMMAVAEMFEKLHEFMHYLGGYDSWMGVMQGPARVVLP